MKKKLLIISSFLSIALLTGCSHKEPTLEEKAELEQEKKEAMIESIKDLPQWVISPKVEGSIAAVGMTNYSKHGLNAMLTMAEMDARAKLAGQIQTTVSQLQENSMRKMQIENIDEFETIFSQVTKEIIKEIPLSGAQRINIHQAKDGTLYVLMSINNKNILKILEENKGVYKAHMQNAKVAKENLDQGMIVLDGMIDKLEEATQE